MARQASKDSLWTVVAAMSLAGVVIAAALFIVEVISSSVRFWGGTLGLGDIAARRSTSIAAIVVLLAFVVIAVVSAVRGSTAARVVAGFAIVLGLASAGLFAVGVWADQRTIDAAAPAPPAPAAVTCGPEYRPPVYGGGDTWRSCPADAASALASAQGVADSLHGVDPTVQVLRDRMLEAGIEQPSVVGDDGSVHGFWVTKQRVCAVVIGDASGWFASATELLVDGGCSNRPAGAD